MPPASLPAMAVTMPGPMAAKMSSSLLFCLLEPPVCSSACFSASCSADSVASPVWKLLRSNGLCESMSTTRPVLPFCFKTIVPHVVYQQSFVSLVISMIGTTIAPWMMFFNQSNVVEKGIKPNELFTQKVDVVSGTVSACLVAWFIIVTTGTVLYPQGIVISDAADAAAALAPFAGKYAEALFAIGLIAASFLAACVLPLTTAFVICEAFGWEAGVSFKWKEAPLFKSIFTFVIAFSAVIVLIPNIDLMGVMLMAQFINGLVLPVLLVFMALISSDKRVMGKFKSGRVTKVLIWVTVGIVSVLTAILLVMQVFGIG